MGAMSVQFRIVLIVGAIVTMVSMLRRIRKKKVHIDDTVFWVVFSFLLVVIALVPEIVYFFSRLLGVMSPANLVMAGIILILIIKMFLMTLEISDLKQKVKGLSQDIALHGEKEAFLDREAPVEEERRTLSDHKAPVEEERRILSDHEAPVEEERQTLSDHEVPVEEELQTAAGHRGFCK